MNLSNSELHYIKEKLNQLLAHTSDIFSQNVKQLLFQKYQEPHRAYHNLSHIYNLLQLADQYFPNGNRVFELAIWYHDIIYQPQQRDNELQSANLFLKHFKSDKSPLFFLNEENILWIKETILSTYGHQPRQDDFNQKLFLDIDLSILAADEITYLQYAKAIREEYNVYSDELYKAGRKQVLEHFLQRPFIFFTKAFEPLESIARQNIQKEIKFLESKIS